MARLCRIQCFREVGDEATVVTGFQIIRTGSRDALPDPLTSERALLSEGRALEGLHVTFRIAPTAAN